MSKKIEERLPEDKQCILTADEMNYLKALDQVGFSFQHYIHVLKQDYLKLIAMRFGHHPENDAELTIDLNDPKRILHVKEIR